MFSVPRCWARRFEGYRVRELVLDDQDPGRADALGTVRAVAMILEQRALTRPIQEDWPWRDRRKCRGDPSVNEQGAAVENR
jgi:hypothetical protein